MHSNWMKMRSESIFSNSSVGIEKKGPSCNICPPREDGALPSGLQREGRRL